MAKAIASWVVADAKAQVMRCDRCGETEPLSVLYGKRLMFAAGIMKAFVEAHKRCRPAADGGLLDG